MAKEIKEVTLEQALQIVFYMAERKHQDESCGLSKEPCKYCAALSKLAKNFPEMLKNERIKPYL